MYIHSLQTRNFRNLEPARIEFSDRANFITGRNGQGKTNLMEAVYWLISLRGKRGNTSDAIRKGESGFSLKSESTFGELRHEVSLAVDGRALKLTIDGSPPRRRREYLEQVLVVDFFPEDLLILLMEPALRRRFLDIACAQFDLPHEDTLRRFKRILEQRNSLLKNEFGPDKNVLDSFDLPLAQSASAVTSARLNMLRLLGDRTDSIFRDGIGEKYIASLKYLPSISEIPSLPDSSPTFHPAQFTDIFLDAFRQNRSRDIPAGRTLIGPQRDDFELTLNEKPVRSFASRGEIRSAMFALHLARFHVLTEKRGISPVVLIDDVMSELDSERRKRVIELLPSGQVFLTSCDTPDDFGKFSDGDIRFFIVEKGVVTQIR